MEVERPEPVDISDMNFVDDEDLQASLSKARRIATKKAIKTLTPEQIAKNRKSSRLRELFTARPWFGMRGLQLTRWYFFPFPLVAESSAMAMDEDDTPTGGLVISDVSEFVSNLSSSAIQIPSARSAPASKAREKSTEPADVSIPAEGNHANEDSEMADTQDQEDVEEAGSRTRAMSESSEDKDHSTKESNGAEEQSTVCFYYSTMKELGQIHC
jgi:U4/U6.U5 tri-snRNP-associated protein 1